MCTHKKPKNEFLGYFWSKSAGLLIALAIVAFLIIHLHPLTEKWAWTIAQALITANGLVLGFSVLGVTVVSQKAFSPSRMSDIFEKHLKKSLEEMKNVKVSESEKIDEKYSEAAKAAIVEIMLVPSALFDTMYILVTSLILALTLFGVSNSTATNNLFVGVFTVTMLGSILLLALGIYLTFRVLKELTLKTTSKDLMVAAKHAYENVLGNDAPV